MKTVLEFARLVLAVVLGLGVVLLVDFVLKALHLAPWPFYELFLILIVLPLGVIGIRRALGRVPPFRRNVNAPTIPSDR